MVRPPVVRRWVIWPLETPTQLAGALTFTSYRALSDGWSLDGYHVNAPYGSCIVQSWPPLVTRMPTRAMSERLAGPGAGLGVPR